MKDSTNTASVERMKTLQSIESDAAAAWKVKGMLTSQKSLDTARASLIRDDSGSRRAFAFVDRMAGRRLSKRK